MAIAACFVFRREISRSVFWDFFDKYRPKATSTKRCRSRTIDDALARLQLGLVCPSLRELFEALPTRSPDHCAAIKRELLGFSRLSRPARFHVEAKNWPIFLPQG
jgi:hypothetical protein